MQDYKAKVILWNRIKVNEWPKDLKSYTVRYFTIKECYTFIEHLHDIKFEAKSEEEMEKEHLAKAPVKNGEANKQLYEKLKAACEEAGWLDPRSAMSWTKLHQLSPEQVLRTIDYRVWTPQDRKNINNLLRSGLISKQKA